MPPVNDSLVKLVESVDTGAFVTAAAFIGSIPTFALGDGALLHGPMGAQKRIEAHKGSILVAAADNNQLVTGGDDGRVIRFDATGQTTEIANENNRWIDAVALGPGSAIAWSFGKMARARDGKGATRSMFTPSS